MSYDPKNRDEPRRQYRRARPVSPAAPRLVVSDGPAWSHVWHWRARLPERKGLPCRVLARGRLNSILVEFEDGFRVVTSRHAVRRTSP